MDMNSEYLEWLELFGDAARRRCWLLWKALECSPLDRAIDLARAADQFVSHAPAEDRIVDASSHPTPVALPQPSSELTHSPLEVPVSPEKPASQKRTPLALSPERREQLLQRLAQGARNAELASEFGLSKQQVQGVRMGSARQIANRRHTVMNGNKSRGQRRISPHRLTRSCVIYANRMTWLFGRRTATFS
jgi:hypothetical protein